MHCSISEILNKFWHQANRTKEQELQQIVAENKEQA